MGPLAALTTLAMLAGAKEHGDDFAGEMPLVGIEYVDGPRVSDGLDKRCGGSSWYGTLQEAQARCTSDPSCHALHDFQCDGRGWRTCSVAVGEMKATRGGDGACTKVKRHVEVAYLDGPRVANGLDGQCGGATWYGTLEEATAKCASDPSCHALHDFQCDGRGWRVCSMAVGEMKAARGGSGACTKAKQHVEVAYVDGPMVSDEFYLDCGGASWYARLEEAESKCTEDPSCNALHDFQCDGKGWRLCRLTVGDMKAFPRSGQANSCTKTKQRNIRLEEQPKARSDDLDAEPEAAAFNWIAEPGDKRDTIGTVVTSEQVLV